MRFPPRSRIIRLVTYCMTFRSAVLAAKAQEAAYWRSNRLRDDKPMLTITALSMLLATTATNHGTATSRGAVVPAVAGAACLKSWTPLGGNLPLGSSERFTEVTQIWKLFLPVGPGSRVFAGWVYENRHHDQFVQTNSDATANALGRYVATLPKNAQIATSGLKRFAYDPIGRARLGQQFLATLASKRMIEPCFAAALK